MNLLQRDALDWEPGAGALQRAPARCPPLIRRNRRASRWRTSGTCHCRPARGWCRRRDRRSGRRPARPASGLAALAGLVGRLVLLIAVCRRVHRQGSSRRVPGLEAARAAPRTLRGAGAAHPPKHPGQAVDRQIGQGMAVMPPLGSGLTGVTSSPASSVPGDGFCLSVNTLLPHAIGERGPRRHRGHRAREPPTRSAP